MVTRQQDEAIAVQHTGASVKAIKRWGCPALLPKPFEIKPLAKPLASPVPP